MLITFDIIALLKRNVWFQVEKQPCRVGVANKMASASQRSLRP